MNRFIEWVELMYWNRVLWVLKKVGGYRDLCIKAPDGMVELHKVKGTINALVTTWGKYDVKQQISINLEYTARKI